MNSGSGLTIFGSATGSAKLETLLGPTANLGGQYSFVSQFMTLNLPKDIQLRLLGSNDCDDLADALLYSRLAHERTHFVQNICSTYGIWKTILLRTAGAYALASIDKYNKRHNDIRFPFEEMLPRNIVYPVNYNDPFFLGSMAKSFLSWLSLMEDYHKYQYTAGLRFFSNVEPPTEETTPSVLFEGSQTVSKLGARELLEFQARSAELGCLYNTNGISRKHRDEILPTIWADETSQAALRLSDRAFGERSSNSWYASLALCEVALNPPSLGLVFASEYGETVPWEVVHPGWRFATLLQLIKRQHIPVPSPVELDSFKTSLCRELSWPTPLEALRSNLDEMKSSVIETLGLFMKAVQVGLASRRSLRRNLIHPYAPEYFEDISFGLRGPIVVEGKPIDLQACTLDIALQLFLGRSVLCPVCFDRNHEPDCIGKGIVDELTKRSLN